jgi:peptidoglycan/xylan/chitin deacetylase (PgdA/CDA1 family)
VTDRRDLAGRRGAPPAVRWPNGARVAVSLVVNLEEGAELSVADGDERNETVYEAVDDVGPLPDPCMESHYGYGTRAGWPRIARLLADHGVAATISACGRAAARSPWLVREAVELGHEVSCHGWRWERHAGMDEATERDVIARTHDAIADATGIAPVGWHTRSAATPNTRRLLVEHGGFLYDSDAYDDDMPYTLTVAGRRHLVLPYAFDTNDMRFQPGGAFVHGEDFARYCLAAYDALAAEGSEAPRMMSVGLHLRIIGRPARIGGLALLLEGLAARGTAFVATRAAIARHWLCATAGGES